MSARSARGQHRTSSRSQTTKVSIASGEWTFYASVSP
jgi:hypothetical protein